MLRPCSALFLSAMVLVWAGLAPSGSAAPSGKSSDRFRQFQQRAAKFNSVVTLPEFETTTNEVGVLVRKTMEAGNRALDKVAAIKPRRVNFKNTVGALDDIGYEISLAGNRLALIKDTSTNAALREAANDALKELQEWSVGLDYREDVYRAVKAYADTRPQLTGEDAKLLAETMRDYRRAGLDLPKAQRDEVERMRKELSRLGTDFSANINKAQKAVKLTRAELEGVPESFLEQLKTADNQYTIMANVTWQFLAVQENAKNEAVRQRLVAERDNLAREENLPLLEKIIPLRDRIAKKLGYQNWADYQIEVKMARTGAAAIDFLERLKTGLQPKFDAELAEFKRLKAKETGQADPVIYVWDWRYFANQLKKEKYTVDAEQLRVYFPYQRVLDGMFKIYQSIFGLKFEPLDPPHKWIGDLQLYMVSDSSSGEPLGLFYLDMFPREGKYNHFAQFSLLEGKLLPNGKYQRPTCALVCNFPTPSGDKPSLLSHTDVETLFHEFGHAMHSLLTRARYVRFAGVRVPGDFVEAPSQMLENWIWDKKVLDSFAADYRDPSKKIPAEILAKLKEARLATEGSHYRRQLSFGLTDLRLHTRITETNRAEMLPLALKTLNEVFLPLAPNTAFIPYFGHLVGYDGGYYGYAWADAISADLATVFERAPKGYFDEAAGHRLRTEIYEPGDARDVNVSIEKFLGRPRSIDPFLKQIGIGK